MREACKDACVAARGVRVCVEGREPCRRLSARVCLYFSLSPPLPLSPLPSLSLARSLPRSLGRYEYARKIIDFGHAQTARDSVWYTGQHWSFEGNGRHVTKDRILKDRLGSP